MIAEMSTVISVKNLVKRYGKLSAVDGISFEVQKGEVFGLLGAYIEPNDGMPDASLFCSGKNNCQR